MDFSKAFDCVNHQILLDKLFLYAIRGLPHRWFKSYLFNRKQFVRLGSWDSELKTINIGVPQGSILGPILFIIYVNDLPHVSQSLKPTIFADDTTLSMSHHNYNDLILEVNRELDLLNEWTLANRLSINCAKTELFLVSNRKHSDNNIPIILNNQILKFTDLCTFLGVILDNRLTFSNHIKFITNKLAKSTGVFYCIKDFLDTQARLKFYYGFVYPYIAYNIIVWGSTYRSHLNPLILQQKRIIRLIANADRLEHTSPLFYRYNILKVEDVYRYFICIHVFKSRNNREFIIDHQYPTRSRENAAIGFQRLTKSQQSVSFAGPNIWNQLPISIRQIKSFPKFKTCLKKYLIETYSSTSSL